MATHSSVFAWRVPGTGEPGGLPSMGSHRVGHDWSDLAAERIRQQVVLILKPFQDFPNPQFSSNAGPDLPQQAYKLVDISQRNRYSTMLTSCTMLNSCKTQNSGLCSKEEKPRDPMNQSSRCNTQEGLLSVAQTRWLWSPGRQSTPNSKLGKLLWAKKPHYQHITYGLQSDWLHVCKAILLVQTSRATCLQCNSIGTTSRAFVQT